MRKSVLIPALLILPVLFLLFGISFNRTHYANDPDYIYLVNALNLLKGQPVGHVDNPGTTVMEMSAAILAAASVFDGHHDQSLLERVIRDPDHSIQLIRITFIVMIMLLLLLLGWVAWKKTGSLWNALILQITPFLSANVLEHVWTKVSPEPVLFMVSTLLVIVLLYYLYDPERDSWKYVILFALVSGFGLATKATYFPLFFIPLLRLRGWSRKALFILGTAVTFVVFTSPAIPEYRHMFNWFYRLTTHTGIYGQGSDGVIDTQTYFSNIGQIFRANPVMTAVFFVSLIMVVIFLVRKITGRATDDKHDGPIPSVKLLAAITFMIALSILIVAKHYHANHYLLPAQGFLGLAVFLIILSLERLIRLPVLTRIASPVLFTALVVIFMIGNIPYLKTADHYYCLTNEETDATFSRVDEQYAGFTRVYYYPNTINKFSALKFGNAYAKRRILPELKAVYPETYFYDVRTYLFYNWEAEMSMEDLLRMSGKKIIFLSRVISGEEAETIGRKGFPLKEVDRGRIHSLYELDTSAIEPLLARMNEPAGERMFCDADSLTDDHSCFVNQAHTFGGGWLQSNEQSRSGSFSLKLDTKNRYGLEVALTGLKASDRFRISVWRLGDYYESHLVAASTKPGVFYKSVNDNILSDDKGWKQLVMYVTVPDGLGDDPLKVYLWNSGKQTVYFDDLEIVKLN
ncbi:MAG: hypothetical protein PHD61_00280 [Bacteroidales bacterium]|nr:hypothetical protein [Bacteroidales bacterium]